MIKSKKIKIKFISLFLALIMGVSIMSGCSEIKELLNDKINTVKTTDELDITENSADKNNKPETTATTEQVAEPTVFEQDLEYLKSLNIDLPKVRPQGNISNEQLIDIIAEVYEAFAGEIDLSLMNPAYEVSEGIKKLTYLGIYYSDYFYEKPEPYVVTYSQASFWLTEIYNKLLQDSVKRQNKTAIVEDLLKRINISTSLYVWTPEMTEHITFTVDDLLADYAAKEAQNQSDYVIRGDDQLTRIIAAHMLVNAFETFNGEIIPDRQNKPSDTNDLAAWKANNFMIWPDDEKFNPNQTGDWDDVYFLGALDYDSQLSMTMKPGDPRCPYGAIISALANLARSCSLLNFNFPPETVVLNERPYPWFVYQLDTGEYGDVNCMPSCIEMSIRYQNLPFVPSTENMRAEHPLDGQGWTDFLAEEVMYQYDLNFGWAYAEDIEGSLDYMMHLLEEGNILYVMYIETYAYEGHAVILKGYRQRGDLIEFIVSDPNSSQIGSYGYPDYFKDARVMIEDIMRHVPRYFIIYPD